MVKCIILYCRAHVCDYSHNTLCYNYKYASSFGATLLVPVLTGLVVHSCSQPYLLKQSQSTLHPFEHPVLQVVLQYVGGLGCDNCIVQQSCECMLESDWYALYTGWGQEPYNIIMHLNRLCLSFALEEACSQD